MRTRNWFLLSLALFIAGASFWRLGEQRRAASQSAKESTAVSSEISRQTPAPEAVVPPAVSAKKLLIDSATDSAATNSANSTNAPVLYPHRLQNTSQTIEQLVRNDKAILLRNAHIDTGAESVEIPDELRAQGDPGSYIVQSRGVVNATFRAALIAANAEIISYVPNNAFLVRVESGGAKQLAANKQVQSVLPYEPYYKLDTDLLALAMEKKELAPGKTLRVTLFPGQRESALAALKGKATVISEDASSSPFGPELIVASADLIELAKLPQVQEIEPFFDREILNDLTRERLNVAANTVVGTPNYLTLVGSNVWVNVNDTTIDTNHPDLSPRIFVGVGDGVDEDGHGTHVAGIIASSGANGPTGAQLAEVGSLSNADFRGKAPAANIFSLDIFAPGLSDAAMQQTAAKTNYLAPLNRQSPLISNNSWGYGTPNYNSSSASFDAAVRDALPGTIGSQPVAYVFAAGNSGGGGNNGQSGFPNTVLSPGNAKNVITVGAIESFRNITNEVIRPNTSCITITNQDFLGLTDSSNQVAFFSSRGNVGVSQEGTFGRLKPDVVAPGTFIASTRSGALDEESYYSSLHSETIFLPGRIIAPFGTNRFSVIIPDNPCDEGTTLSLTINTIIRSPITTNPLPLLIYAGNAPIPSSNPANFRGVDTVFIDRVDLPLGELLFCEILNTNDIEIEFDIRTSLVLSNDFGDHFQVLSNLNDKLAPHYMFESGTSMAAPAVSGMLALMQDFFESRFQITNSPAMMKALLINGSRSFGTYTYEKERAVNHHGWGLPDFTQILSTNATAANWPMQLFDQSTNFALATGDQHDRVVTVNDTEAPLRITLVWTDPPGNPAVGVKLVNDLDLVVTAIVTNAFETNIVTTNVYFGNNFTGGEFTQASEMGTNGLVDFELVRDTVNNVENVYINSPLSGSYTVSVVGRRVNVNAVTAHTNEIAQDYGIAQDYALVISGGNLETGPSFTVATNTVLPNTNASVTIISNAFSDGSFGGYFAKQRVGANSPIQNVNANNLTDGTNVQWTFYVLENPDKHQNIAFVTFFPPNLSGASNTIPGSRRIVEADIDMYVSTDPTLTNLNPVAIAGADKSLSRGGRESIVYTNRNDEFFYVGIKSEDQRAAEFSFFAVASAFPFSQDDGNGNLILNGVPNIPADVPDGSPENPGGWPILMIATQPIKVGRVIVTNVITHERVGDWIQTLEHNDISAVLQNHSHSLPDVAVNNLELIYDDSGLTGSDALAFSQPTDGPGSLNNFIGEEAIGVWMLTVEDSSVGATGRVERISMFLEKSLETNSLSDGGNGFTISPIGIPAGQSRGLSFVVPLNATNMIITMAPKEGPIDTVVRQGRFVPTRSGPGGPYVNHGMIINPPGGSFNVDLSDTPPLKPGPYSLRLFNDGPANPVTVSGEIRFELDLTARSLQTYSGGPIALLDDALTNSTIHVSREGLVVSTEVSVRIDHPRVSDLVLHLVSPQGTRVLLAENRGGLSTNGYGFSNLETNLFPETESGGGTEAQTNTFGPVLTSGIIQIDYQFFDLDPDQMQVFYDGVLIYDTGMVLGSNSITIPYGPGIDTEIVVIMNPNGNASSGTLWNYTLTVFSGDLVYATFSENTNLAVVPIKFAIPPFATNIPGSNTLTFDSSYFEDPTAPGTYTVPDTFDGWTVKTNSVDVIGDATRAHRGTNFLALEGGGAALGADIIAGPILNPANGHYYYLLASNTWTASEARALTLGGHLATINDAAENNWVFSTFGSYGGISRALWIGLTDQAQEGTFVWADGDGAAYRNWSPGEPNSFNPIEDYVHIWPPGDPRGGRWNDKDNVSNYGSPSVFVYGVVEVESIASTGGITRTLPTTAGQFYNLKFAHRRGDPASLSSATITLDGVFTNEFVGNPSWIVHSTSFVAPANGTKLDIDGLPSQGGGSGGGGSSSQNLINNGGFEQGGLAGWNFNAGVGIFTNYPPSEGTTCVIIGALDNPGSFISQTFPVVGGTTYQLSFDMLSTVDIRFNTATAFRVDLITPLGILLSQSYTNPGVNTPPFIYDSYSIPFTVPAGVSSMTLQFSDLSPNNGVAADPVLDNVQITGSQPGMWFDTFELSEGGDPNYFLPEESLKTLIGQRTQGDWKLEIWDNRVGEPLGGAQLVSWQLHLTFASSNATATPVSSGTPATNTVSGNEIQYFIIDVPIFATQATNVLVSGGGPLNLLFNQDELPIGRTGNGDFTLLSGTVNGTHLLTTTTFPELRPGHRYYLGVQNANPSQTNFFTLTVTFNDTNNLVNVTPLTNATPYSTSIPLSSSIHYYQYDLSNTVSTIRFELFDLSADADLVVRRNALPTQNSYDYNSNLGGTNNEVIPVSNPAPGRYYLGVYGFFPTNTITYTVMVTEGAASPAPKFSSPTLTASGFQVSVNTIIGRQYEFAVSTDLVNWTVITTKTATANITVFNDPTPPATQTARFYRLRELP